MCRRPGSTNGLLDELRLAAIPVRRDNHPARDRVRDPAALLLADQVQARINAGGGAGTGDHRIRVDVQHRRVDLSGRVEPGQPSGVPPVRRAGPAVQQSGGAKHERAGAHAQHPRAALDRPLQCSQQRLRPLGPAAAVVARRGHDDQVGGFEAVQSERRLQCESGFGPQLARLTSHDREVVARQSLVSAIRPEHLADHTQLERSEPVQNNDSDVFQHGHHDARELAGC